MDALLADLRFAFRNARKTLHLSAAAVACMALGTAGAVFIFTIATVVLRQAPPFPDAERLVRIWTYRQGTSQRADLSYLDATDLRAQAQSFDAIEMAARTRAAITTEDGTERVRGESVTSGYFAAVAQRPQTGRLFSADEYAPGGPRVIVISHSLWLRKFGQRPDIAGHTLTIRGGVGMGGEANPPFTIVGVMPPGFSGTVDTDVSEFWLPIEQYTPRMVLDMRAVRSTWVLARLAPGASVESAQTEVAAIGRRLATAYPNDYRDISLGVEPLGETWRARFRDGLRLLTGASVLLLLIACANISHLMLARVAQREREFALREALGASRGAILRLLVVESVTLSTIGSVAGVALAVAGIKMFSAAQVLQLPSYVAFDIGIAAPMAAIGVTVLAALLSGPVAGWLVMQTSGAGTSRAVGSAAQLGRRQRRAVNAVVAAEVGCSFVLLVGAMVMLRSYGNLVSADVGYRTANLQRLAITLNAAQFPDSAAQLAFVRDARTALAARPHVEGVTFIAGVLPPWFDPEVSIAVRGESRRELAAVNRHAVDHDFFRVLDISVREGRAFDATDRTGSRRVAIVSRSVAAAIAGPDGGSVIGATIHLERQRDSLRGVPVEIVGVAEDVEYHGPRPGRPAQHDVYVPIAHAPDAVVSVAVATSQDPGRTLTDLQRTLGALAPTSPIHWVSTMHAELGLQFTDARLYAWLTGVFGGSALLLVSLGIYGLVSNAVTRRFAELGIRIAVGARSIDIVRLVVAQALRPIAAGLVVGIPVAIACASFAGALVYGITPSDPLTHVAVAALIIGVGLVACVVPACRAARVDPKRILQGG